MNVMHYKTLTNVLHNFNFITQWNIVSKSIQHYFLIKILLFMVIKQLELKFSWIQREDVLYMHRKIKVDECQIIRFVLKG
jgi:hypothetical protein